ncbi:TetR/AcrR family transcriptional regulator [Actinoplanes awajinensis]|uniref:TetR family transcriptional regulator n=1 Tax=Actinoplanes awajinensis subsp. mycoplanecinus TaxID=135947 RepID=A0A0X3UNW7_9ACTN|nr:TetR/AcrR family transcriptional regulator [Actinoplanes awajinensis]KUL34215.1 TetR family transcriptional regulator [Actinoplanes awajinensis subsp. mycoplanecinus]
MAGQRADARRNYELLLAVAKQAVAEQGTDASLEQIARTAGVGSGTVRRHFPTRHDLLEAVFRKQIDELSEQAASLAGHPDSRAALLEWLGSVLTFGATTRGLAEALNRDHIAAAGGRDQPASPGGATHGRDQLAGAGEGHEHCATARLTEAGEPLVRRAAADGMVTPGVTITDLLNLITGIALATEHHPDGAAEASRLLGLTVAGVSPV